MDTLKINNPNFSGVTANGSYATGSPVLSSNELYKTPELKLPTVNVPAPSAPIASAPATNTEAATQAVQPTQAEQQSNAVVNRIKELYTKVTGKQEDATKAQEAAGVPVLKKQISDINAQIAQLTNDQQAQDVQALSNAARLGGVSAASLGADKAERDRQIAVKQLSLSSVRSALEGNLALAQDQADRAVNDKYAPMEAELKGLKDFLDINKDVLARDDAKRAKVLEAQLADRKEKLDVQKENDKTLQGLALQAAQNDAPATVVNAIINASSPLKAIELGAGYLNKETNAAIQEYKFAVRNGYNGSFSQYQNEDANRKMAIQRAGQGIGLLSNLPTSIQGKLVTISDDFGKSDIVKRFNATTEALRTVNNIDPLSKNPADHQSIIYSFAKSLDPDSVVREGEYATVKKYSQSLLNKYEGEINQAINGTGFLSPKAIADIKLAMLNNFNSKKPVYDNLYQQTSAKLNSIAGSNVSDKLLVNYDIPSTTGGGPAKTINIKGNTYEVGKVYVNSKGQKGLVNADGTITLQ